MSFSDCLKQSEIEFWIKSFEKNPSNFSKYTNMVIYNEILPKINISDTDNPYIKFIEFIKSKNKSSRYRDNSSVLFKNLKIKYDNDSFSNEKCEKDIKLPKLDKYIISLIFSFIHPQFERLIHNKYPIEKSEKISINVLINSYLIYDDYFTNVKKLIFSSAKIFFSIKDKIFLNYIIENSIFSRANLCNKKNLCTKTVEYGNVDFLKFVVEKGFPFDENTTATAVKKGYFNILIYLIEKGCSYDKRICSFAAAEGNLNILRWACENGYPLDKSVCKYAAKNGHLECLVLARQYNCPWDSFVCDNASSGGHLNILRWAVENNCDFVPESCLKEAKTNNHIDIVSYIENLFLIF